MLGDYRDHRLWGIFVGTGLGYVYVSYQVTRFHTFRRTNTVLSLLRECHCETKLLFGYTLGVVCYWIIIVNVISKILEILINTIVTIIEQLM